jgi:hypothetical protein
VKISKKVTGIFSVGTFVPIIMAIIGHAMMSIYIDIFIGLASYAWINSLGKFIAAEFGSIIAIYGDDLFGVIKLRKQS